VQFPAEKLPIIAKVLDEFLSRESGSPDEKSVAATQSAVPIYAVGQALCFLKRMGRSGFTMDVKPRRVSRSLLPCPVRFNAGER
jgi:hypothetical protein